MRLCKLREAIGYGLVGLVLVIWLTILATLCVLFSPFYLMEWLKKRKHIVCFMA